jgi:predicted dehydrogenase
VLRDGALQTQQLTTENGAYPSYYAGVRDALRGTGPNPVPARAALTVMRLLDAGRISAAERREVLLSELAA